MTLLPSSFGSWKSPITSDLIVSETVKLDYVTVDGSDVYWIEGRPSEGGRSVIMRRSAAGNITDVINPPFNARNRVHEYGGGAMFASGGVIYFSHFTDQRIYRVVPGEMPEPLTPPKTVGQWRFADIVVDRRRNRLICVREDHSAPGLEPLNTIVSISLDSPSQGEVLVHGNDFYASPRVSPDGQYLAWLTWNHPNMPWDGTELWIGQIHPDGNILHKVCVAGSGGQESIFQPQWWVDNTLFFISDRTDWWNLYRWRADMEVEPVLEMEAEFVHPQWVFKMSTYGFLSSHRIACAYTRHGIWHLGIIDLTTKRLVPIRSPYTHVSMLCVDASHNAILMIAGSPTKSESLLRLNLDHPDPDSSSKHRVEVLRMSNKAAVDNGYISVPQEISFPAGEHKKTHAFFYPPKNKDYSAPQEELPPLLVISHGGPTSCAHTSLNLSIQFWTSRGFAVLDVNYGGSSGFGRPYRQRLKGQWGIVDVNDCVNGARFLAEHGKVDFARLAIRGGSAGGYTTLCALTFHGVFKAGASYYGVSDLEALALETHKFEAHYLDSLIGPYPAQKETYRSRSPIYNINQISCPIIFFQGLDDKVVLPNQTEKMFVSLRDGGLPVAYVPFEGEGHGFRKAENIKRALDAELYFYGRVFGFETGEIIPPVQIENL